MASTVQYPVAGPSNGAARLRTRSKSKPRPLLSKQASMAEKQTSKTLYTPVFYPTQDGPGPSTLPAKEGATPRRSTQGASRAAQTTAKGKGKGKDPGLSEATLKRLEQLSRMHIALSSDTIPCIPSSQGGSPAPPDSKHVSNDTQEVLEVLKDLPNLPSTITDNPRILKLRAAIIDALEDCNYDPSHGKWALVSNLVKLGVSTGRGGRWLGATGLDSGQRTQKEDGKEEVILPPDHDIGRLLKIDPQTGTNSRGVGWCNAATEEQWCIWEEKFEDEMRLRRKIEQWQRGIVPDSQDAPLPFDAYDHDQREEEEPTRRGKYVAVTVAQASSQSQSSTRARPNPLKSTSALGSLGFSMSKRNAVASSSKRPPQAARQPGKDSKRQGHSRQLTNTNPRQEIVQDLRVSLADLEISRNTRRPYAGSIAGSAISRSSSKKRELLVRKKPFEGYVSGYSSRAGSEAGDLLSRPASRAGSPGVPGDKVKEADGKEAKRRREKEAEDKETEKLKEAEKRAKQREDEKKARNERYANPTTQERRAAANGMMNLGDTSAEMSTFQPPSLEPSFRFSQIVTSTPLQLPVLAPRSRSRKPGPTAEVLLQLQGQVDAQFQGNVLLQPIPPPVAKSPPTPRAAQSHSLPPGLNLAAPASPILRSYGRIGRATPKDASMASIPALNEPPESPTPASRKGKRKLDQLVASPKALDRDEPELKKKPRTETGNSIGHTGSLLPHYNSANVSSMEQGQVDSLYQQQQQQQLQQQESVSAQQKSLNQISQDSLYNPLTPVKAAPVPSTQLQPPDQVGQDPSTPVKDVSQAAQRPRFVDLLESAKKAKQERIARRKSAKAARKRDSAAQRAPGEGSPRLEIGGGEEAPAPGVDNELRFRPRPSTKVEAAGDVAPAAAANVPQSTIDTLPVANGARATALAPAAVAVIADVFCVHQDDPTPPASSDPTQQQKSQAPPAQPIEAETSWPSQIPGLSGGGSAAGAADAKAKGDGLASSAEVSSAEVVAPQEQPSTPIAPPVSTIQDNEAPTHLPQGSPMRLSPAPVRHNAPGPTPVQGTSHLNLPLEEQHLDKATLDIALSPGGAMQQSTLNPTRQGKSDQHDELGEEDGFVVPDALVEEGNDGESDHVDIMVPLRDHESEVSSVHSLRGKFTLNPLDAANLDEVDIYTNDDDTRSVYAIDYASDVDLKSPAKSLSSLAGSASDSDEEEYGDTFDIPPPETNFEFDPQFASTQVNNPNGQPSFKTPTKSNVFAASQPVTPSKFLASQPTPNKFPMSSQFGFGFSQGYGGGYNSQFDVNASIAEVDKLLEKDVDFDGWIKDLSETGADAVANEGDNN